MERPDEATIARLRARHLEHSVQDKRRKMFEKCYAKTASPRMAIKTMCYECSGADVANAKACNSVTCPLWEYNPYRLEAEEGHSSPSEKEEGDDDGEEAS